MKEEVLNSTLMSLRHWNALTPQIETLLNSEWSKKIKSNGRDVDRYAIASDEPFDEEHIRAIKMWTDFTDFSSECSAILRRGDPVEIAEIANWTRTLIETVQCYGSPLEGHTKYYRGLNSAILFNSMLLSCSNIPIPTTLSVMLYFKTPFTFYILICFFCSYSTLATTRNVRGCHEQMFGLSELPRD